jgi:hypothetical protein
MCVLIVSYAGSVDASGYERYSEEYPPESYLIGIGELQATGNRITDKRVADVLARREIAAQIRVNVSEATVDLMCSSSNAEDKECRDMVISVVETSVNEFLRGSRIVDSGQKEGIFFSVAVMPKKEAVESVSDHLSESVKLAREEIENARSGKKDALEKARSHYDKARIYEIERQVLEGVKGNASDALRELDAELRRLRQ